MRYLPVLIAAGLLAAQALARVLGRSNTPQ
jgi:hypothetical protein